MKLLFVLIMLMLACLSSQSAGGAVIVRPRYVILSRAVVADRVDVAIRAKYWYYLPDAKLTYLSHTNSNDGCLFMHLYRNYVGTFLAITNYLDNGEIVNINTFVRIGEGVQTPKLVYQPVVVKPVVVSLDLGYGEYLVPRQVTPQGRFLFSETYARSHWFNTVSVQVEAKTRCQVVEEYIRKQYWYYLTGAVTLESSWSNAANQCYCTYHLVNRAGLWQVIGRWDYAYNTARVNTFVRLGDGYDPKVANTCYITPSTYTHWVF